jgi:hypothetical protein
VNLHKCENCPRYLEIIRVQGEFIQSIKRQIRDFNVGEGVKMERSIADRGLR